MKKYISIVLLSLSLLLSCCVTVFASNLQYGEYIGSGYIVGHTPSNQTVEIYVPINSSEYWGVTNDGYLCNVTSTTVTGIMYTNNGTKYNFRCAGWSTPQYRTDNSYTWTDIDIIVDETNMSVSYEYPSSTAWQRYDTLIIIGLIGVVVLCMMRFKR